MPSLSKAGLLCGLLLVGVSCKRVTIPVPSHDGGHDAPEVTDAEGRDAAPDMPEARDAGQDVPAAHDAGRDVAVLHDAGHDMIAPPHDAGRDTALPHDAGHDAGSARDALQGHDAALDGRADGAARDAAVRDAAADAGDAGDAGTGPRG
jgi:hypothetical protein